MNYMEFAEPLRNVLRSIRVGDFDRARSEMASFTPKPPWDLPRMLLGKPTAEQIVLLRLVTLKAEIDEHFAKYSDARTLLDQAYPLVEDELRENRLGRTSFDRRSEPGWKLLREKLGYIRQISIARYRAGRVDESRELLEMARKVAEELSPSAEGLLTQIYYGLGKVASHDGKHLDAAELYRKSLDNAGALLAAEVRYAKEKPERAAKLADETAAAHHSMGLTLALGLGQSLREQGRLREAQLVVVSGQTLLDASHDRVLANYARLLLGSIQRGSARQRDQSLLTEALTNVRACATFFEKNLKDADVWYRSRYELALVIMQQGDADEARRLANELFDDATARARRRWVANAHIVLSRIARREGLYKEAIDAGSKAASIAELAEFEKIERRARVVMALARYAQYVENEDRGALARLESVVDRLLRTLEEHDVRNRVELLLLKSRILVAMNQYAKAQDVYREYKAIGHLVESGRVRDLAETLKAELFPIEATLRLPVDMNPAEYDLARNEKAARAHALRKGFSLHLPEAERAEKFGVSPKTISALRKEHEANETLRLKETLPDSEDGAAT